jgi:hypothetical protein
MPSDQDLLSDLPIDEIPEEAEIDIGPPPPELSHDEVSYQTFDKFALYTLRKREAARQVKEATDVLQRLAPHLLRFFTANPTTQRVGVRGLTIYQTNTLFPRPKENATREDVCAALRANNLGQFVHDDFDGKRLAAHIHELMQEHADELESGLILDTSALLPPALAAVLNVNLTPKVVGRMRPKS